MVLNDHFATTGVEKIRVRNEPIQARSSDRIDALLGAAALVVDEVGVELLTTALVATKANASIGTVYRYFPDRIAVLTALSDRSIERYLGRVRDSVERQRVIRWQDALVVAFDTAEQMHVLEPGFTSIRLGDLVSRGGMQHTSLQSKLATKRVAGGLEHLMVFDCGWPVPSEIIRRLETAVVIADTLLVRAFSVAGGDRVIIDECSRIVRWYLGDHSDQAGAADDNSKNPPS